MKKANLRLMGFLCPRIKHRIQNTIGFYQWFLISLIVNLFVSCQALAQEVKVQQMPLAATVSTNDFKENSTSFKIDGVSPQKQDTSFQEKITPLKIGDKIPEELWDLPLQVVNHPEGKEIVTLRENKDKLIILDFWATWCGTCIDALPRLHGLQAEFNDEIVILPITDQSTDNVKSFLEKNERLSQLKLLSVVEDKVYKSHFPYTMLPHEVWIDNVGRIVAITHASDVTHESISMALEGGERNINQKKDNLTYDSKLPLLVNGNGAEEVFFLNRSIITPYIQGIPSFTTQPVINYKDSSFRVSATNASIISIYSLAFKELRGMPANRIKLETKDAELMSEKNFLKDMYCYDWIAPTSSLKYLQQKIQADINFFFSINGRVEQRKTQCYVIKKTGRTKNLSGVPEKGFQYLSGWVYNVNKNANSKPLLNELDDQPIGIPVIPPSINDVEVLNGMLGQYGLTISEEHRDLDFFIISEL